MSESHFIAMESALSLYRGTSISAAELAQTAETIRLYCSGKLSVEIYFPVNDSGGFREHIGDIAGISVNDLVSSRSVIDDTLAVCGGEVESDVQNKRFSVHKDNSSKKESNCSPELPTPGSIETVIPCGGTVTELGTHGRTDGGE